jgi:hypothetical protein
MTKYLSLLQSQVSYDYVKERFEPDAVVSLAVFKDVNFAACWDLQDYAWVKKQFAKIRAYNDMGYDDKAVELEEAIELKMVRMMDGQYVQDIPNDPKPMQASIKLDVITNQGLVRIISILAKKTTVGFSHYASGDGTSIATIGDTRLQGEKFRISMTTDGFITAAGTVGRFGAVFIPSAPSHAVSEAGVCDAASGGTFLNRTLYPSASRIVHTIFEDFYTLSIALYTSAI